MDHMDWGFKLVGYIEQLVRDNCPELADLFPFSGSRWTAKIDICNGWHMVILEDLGGSGVPVIGSLRNEPWLNQLISSLTSGLTPFEYSNTFNRFTYFAKSDEESFNIKPLSLAIAEWLNNFVLPRVLELNRKRIQHAIPAPPTYNLETIRENIFVLEDESAMVQGSCFKIEKNRFVTCFHCTQDENGNACHNIMIFSPNDTTHKCNAQIAWVDHIADLAVIETTSDIGGSGLQIGDSDNLSMHDHIATAGFPNYRYGDSGFLSPGLVVGFRPVQGITRIIVNIGLVSGISGGPGIDKDGKVVGICATGAPSNSKIHDTENHSLIPANALSRYFNQAHKE